MTIYRAQYAHLRGTSATNGAPGGTVYSSSHTGLTAKLKLPRAKYIVARDALPCGDRSECPDKLPVKVERWHGRPNAANVVGLLEGRGWGRDV